MGCYKSRCKFCKHIAKGDNQFQLMLNCSEHIKKEHPKIFEKNKKAELEYKKDCKKALDKRLKNSIVPTFSQTEWDGEDYCE